MIEIICIDYEENLDNTSTSTKKPSPGKLDGIGSLFNRGQDQVRVNPNAITVEIDNSGDNQQQQQQIGYIQQPDGQLVMVNLGKWLKNYFFTFLELIF